MDGELPPRDYEVGYGKPPQHSRFQPGRSGNPNGRPTGSRNLSTEFRQLLKAKVTVTEDGRRQKITKRKVILTQLINKSASGDLNATRLVLSLDQGLEALAVQELARVPRTEDRSLSEDDASVLANLHARLFGKEDPNDA